MASQDTTQTRRRRGSVRRRGNSLQVRVFAGVDPVTGKEVYLTGSITSGWTACSGRTER